MFISKESFIFLKGTEIDYVIKGLNSELIFNNPNITIKKNIRALRFYQKTKDRIDSVEVCNSYGEKFKIKSPNFILACGGIENTRILFNSNNFFKEGLGNENKLLGKFLSTHPKANVGIVSLKKKIDIVSKKIIVIFN